MSMEEAQAGSLSQEGKLCVKRFLLRGGFNETSGEVLEMLAEMVLRCAELNEALNAKKKNTLLWKPLRDASLRAKMAYYIPKNFERICTYVYEKYGYEMYPNYVGVKNFVEQIAIIYSVFVIEDKDKN